ncbi:MAG: PQQ-binding-like beta-propeller repeat protein, partial [Planctomycetota bacterium]|nr:PQQ-binding-like beta-propeller repeat protein [Planctomycetota bacterium]
MQKALGATDLRERLAIYTEVYDNYLVSSYGDDALEEAADINLRLGRYYEALAQYRRLLDVYPNDSDRALAMVAAKGAFCAARIGDDEAVVALIEEIEANHAAANLVIEGKVVSAGTLRNHPLLSTRAKSRADTTEDWEMPGGSPSRARVSADIPEWIARKPFWARGIYERDARLHLQFGEWRVAYHDREPTEADPRPISTAATFAAVRPYPTVRPVVKDGIVYFKDGLEIVARSAASGRFLRLRDRDEIDVEKYDSWARDPSKLFPVGSVRPHIRPEGGDKTVRQYERGYRYFDYGGQAIAIGRDLIYVVECERAPKHFLTQARTKKPRNRLIAYERDTGKTRWGWESHIAAQSVASNPELREAWQVDYQRHAQPHFRGPGVIANGLLYTLVHENNPTGASGVSLWAFDAEDGRVRYRTALHYPDELGGLMPIGAALALGGGTVYAMTNAGVVAAVDALPPGRVRWIRRYSRNITGGRRPVRRRRGGGTTASHTGMGFGHNEPIVTNGRVICAPADSEFVFALDALTGKELWSKRRGVPGASIGRPWHIVGVGDGVLVLAGEQICGVDVMSGDLLWIKSCKGNPYGRGFVGEKYAYVPVQLPPDRSAILRYDLRVGTVADPLIFDVAALGNIVFVGGRLIAATEETVMCFTTADVELARLKNVTVRDRIERAHVALAQEPKRRDRARDSFRAAFEIATDAERPDILVPLIENLLEIAAGKGDTEALEEAAGFAKQLKAAEDRAGIKRTTRDHPFVAQVDYLRVKLLGATDRAAEALQKAEKFLDDHPRNSVVVDGHVVTTQAAAEILYNDLLENDSIRAAFAAAIRRQIEGARARGDLETLALLPERYNHRSPSEESYFVRAALLTTAKRTAEAAQVLREFVRHHRGHERAAEAHLRIAVGLARSGLLAEAAAERGKVVLEMLDEEKRRSLADLVAELDGLLPTRDPPPAWPSIRIPLAKSRLTDHSGGAIAIRGTLPDAVPTRAVLADETGYAGIDAAGKKLWSVPTPAAKLAPAGPKDDPTTIVAAAAIHAGRVAYAVDGDLIIGDVVGLVRVDATTGAVKWRYPKNEVRAVTDAQLCVARLREDLGAVARSGPTLRREPLPLYLQTGNMVLRFHPKAGIEALSADGEIVWLEPSASGALVGTPSIMGHLLAVGRNNPGLVTIYDLSNGKPLRTYTVPKNGSLWAPPVLDPLGRLLVIETTSRTGDAGRLKILNTGNLRPAHGRTYEAKTRNAAVLHADGHTVVFHDGASTASSGPQNLHVIDLERGSVIQNRTSDLFRNYRIYRDGSRLFVFTHARGDKPLGARLFRIDIKSGDSLQYAYLPTALAYAVPTITKRYIAVTGSGVRRAHVVLYDRHASAESLDAQAVFKTGQRAEKSQLELGDAGLSDFRDPPSIVPFLGGLLVTNPFGTWRLAA